MADISITRIRQEDRERWTELWAGYLAFYETELPPERYTATWSRIVAGQGPVYAKGARLGGTAGPLVGITHYLFHAHAWLEGEVCYLQDLFVDPGQRGGGAGGKLIAAVADDARTRGCARLYWSTKQDNTVARSLYDKLARFNGFIRYDHPL